MRSYCRYSHVRFVFYLSLSLVYGNAMGVVSVTYHKLIWSSSRRDGEETLFVFLAESRHTLMSLISIGSAGESMATSQISARRPSTKFKFHRLWLCACSHVQNKVQWHARETDIQCTDQCLDGCNYLVACMSEELSIGVVS